MVCVIISLIMVVVMVAAVVMLLMLMMMMLMCKPLAIESFSGQFLQNPRWCNLPNWCCNVAMSLLDVLC